MKSLALRFLSLIFLICLLSGMLPLSSASAKEITSGTTLAFKGSPFPCSLEKAPDGIVISSEPGGELLGMGKTTIAVDPCTLSIVKNQGDQAVVFIQTSGDVPPAFVLLLKQAVIAHADDLWQKDVTCPQPERGIHFTVITPDLWALLLTPTPSVDFFKLLFPNVQCG